MSFTDTFHRNSVGQADLSVETTLLFLDYVTLGLRLWSRRLRRTGLQGSDWLIIAATVRSLDFSAHIWKGKEVDILN